MTCATCVIHRVSFAIFLVFRPVSRLAFSAAIPAVQQQAVTHKACRSWSCRCAHSLDRLALGTRLQRQPTAGGAAFDSRTSGLFCQLIDVRAPAEATNGNDSHFCDPRASRLAVHRVLRLERVSWAGVEDEQEQEGGLGVWDLRAAQTQGPLTARSASAPVTIFTLESTIQSLSFQTSHWREVQASNAHPPGKEA